MPDFFTDQLSAYLDGELDSVSRSRLEAHLPDCAGCAAVLADLKAIVAAAPHYPGRHPSRDLWHDIEARLGEAEVLPLRETVGGEGGRSDGGTNMPSRRFGWRELIAASVLMAAAGGGATWLALAREGRALVHSISRLDRPAVSAAKTPMLRAADSASAKTVGNAEAQYAAAVRDLERMLDAGRSRLDTATVRTIEQSLQKIDAAIAEARAAIQRDPANAYLSRQIASNMRRRLNLLRVATNAIAART